MKKLAITKLLIVAGISLFSSYSMGQNPENWTKKQLVEPADLAMSITMKKDMPLSIYIFLAMLTHRS